MIKVITYGTYDLLHYGHIRLLERAKALGDYLIVGITADSFDRARGKINVQQTLIERIEAVRATKLADEIIVEEYEGQKIDDIKRYNVDVFTVGSDWKGKFDYLKEYCKVVYLERTKGVSSSELRSVTRELNIGLIGKSHILDKFVNESQFVNGINICGVCSMDVPALSPKLKELSCVTNNLDELLDKCDALYVISAPKYHYIQIKNALLKKKHVLCESPIAINQEEWEELQALARQQGVVLMEGIKTAYSMAYDRLILLAKSGQIGTVVSVDATCTSLANKPSDSDFSKLSNEWNSICAWAPTALLPIFQLLGTNYRDKHIITKLISKSSDYDAFTKISLIYPHAVASIKVGQGVKSEGELVISGTKGYIYVPAPWWKTDYFEVRFENASENKRYFYRLEGEGIRYELVTFIRSIQQQERDMSYVSLEISKEIARTIGDFYARRNCTMI